MSQELRRIEMLEKRIEEQDAIIWNLYEKIGALATVLSIMNGGTMFYYADPDNRPEVH